MLVALLIAPVAVGSCVPRTLDTAQLERRIAHQLSDQLNVDGVGVSCPEDVRVAEGHRFRCTATASDGSDAVRIDVTQVDDDGNVTWEISGTAG
jgi:Domain of unknown function (DUF4333)